MAQAQICMEGTYERAHIQELDQDGSKGVDSLEWVHLNTDHVAS